MKKQITHICILQTSKIVAIMACLISAVYAIPFAIYSFAEGDSDMAAALLLQPLIHLIVSFITTVIVSFIYNQITKIFGGIEILTTDVEIKL